MQPEISTENWLWADLTYKAGGESRIVLKLTCRGHRCIYIDAIAYDSFPATPVSHKKCCFESHLLLTQMVLFYVLIASNKYDIVHKADVLV